MSCSTSPVARSSLIAFAAGLYMAAPAIASDCEPHWDQTIGQPGLDHSVIAITVLDEDTGPVVYAGGIFNEAGGQNVMGVARWDGNQWSPVGQIGTIITTIWDLVVFDVGNGPAVYAAVATAISEFEISFFVAEWDGSQWSALGEMNDVVRVLEVFDDGSGPGLYAAGLFTTAGGVAANRIARWDGSQWSPLASGMNNLVRSLTVFDDGLGPALYAGGQFTTAGGVQANSVAKWDGSQWSALGAGIIGPPPQGNNVEALAAFDDGTGMALYAAGAFTVAGGLQVSNVAKWDGSTWSGVGGGIPQSVSALAVFNDNVRGPVLYAGGHFTSAGGVPASRIAKWDGSNWAPVGVGVNSGVGTLVAFEGGHAPVLYVGGSFTMAGGDVANRIAAYRGCPPPLPVHFDIRPGGCPNPLNTKAQGVLPAAILGNLNLDVAQIDAGTMQISRTDGIGGSINPLNGPPGPGIRIEDVGTPIAGETCECNALGPDGIDDLTLKFSIPQLVAELELDTLPTGATIELQITGHLLDGTPFIGTDCITLVGKGNQSGGALPASEGGVPDCLAPDLSCDGTVGVADLLILLANWGACDDCDNCAADLTGSCSVGVADLLILLANWG